MKNVFFYYRTAPLITWPVVINPDHLLLCGLHTHTLQINQSTHTYSLSYTLLLLPQLFFFFFPPLSALHLSLTSLLLSSIFLSMSSFLFWRPFSHSPPSTEPNFVSSYDIGNFTYFFFRENAVEHDCGRTVFSRAGRVCKNDIGGRFLLEDTWTTFMKARLNCSRPGEIPFNYNELQGTFYLPELEMLYGIFTTNVWVIWDFTKEQ